MAKKAGKKALTLRCPTCATIVTAKDEFFPFCCDRCRIIDLGKWASGAYRISSPALDPDSLETIERERSQGEHDHDSDRKRS